MFAADAIDGVPTNEWLQVGTRPVSSAMTKHLYQFNKCQQNIVLDTARRVPTGEIPLFRRDMACHVRDLKSNSSRQITEIVVDTKNRASA